MLLLVCVIATVLAILFFRWEIRMAWRSGYIRRRR